MAGEIVAIGNASGARTIIDIHSEALRHAVARGPWLLKCNRVELLQLLGDDGAQASDSLPDLAREMGRLRQRGIEVVVVTLGQDGALLADTEGVLHVQVPLRSRFVNATGSGDLLLAGLSAGV